MAPAASSQAILTTRRLRLVPLCSDHFEHAVQLDSDPQVMRFVGSGRARTREQVAFHFQDYIARAEPVPGLGVYAGFLRSSPSSSEPGATPLEEFIGWWTLQPPMRPDQGPLLGQAELGYRLKRKFWRQGLAKEGAAELVRHGFADLGLGRIFAETMFVNEGSRATMASVGMKYKRTFNMDFGEDAIPGAELGEVEYQITREEWETMQGPPPEGAPSVP